MRGCLTSVCRRRRPERFGALVPLSIAAVMLSLMLNGAVAALTTVSGRCLTAQLWRCERAVNRWKKKRSLRCRSNPPTVCRSAHIVALAEATVDFRLQPSGPRSESQDDFLLVLDTDWTGVSVEPPAGSRIRRLACQARARSVQTGKNFTTKSTVGTAAHPARRWERRPLHAGDGDRIRLHPLDARAGSCTVWEVSGRHLRQPRCWPQLASH